MFASSKLMNGVAAGACAVALWGCGGDDDGGGGGGGSETPKLDGKTMAQNLQKQLSNQGSSSSTGVNVTSVTCPDEIEAKQGTTFTCQVGGDRDASGTVTVKLLDATGNKVEYEAKLKGPGVVSTKTGTATFNE